MKDVIQRVPAESAMIATVDITHYSVAFRLRTARWAPHTRRTEDRVGGLLLERLLILPKSPVERGEVERDFLRWRCASKSIDVDPVGHIEVDEEEPQYDHNQAEKNGQRIPGEVGARQDHLRRNEQQVNK